MKYGEACLTGCCNMLYVRCMVVWCRSWTAGDSTWFWNTSVQNLYFLCIAFTESDSLANGNTTLFRLKCHPVSVNGEGISRVVHDRAIIVWHTQMVDVTQLVFVKVSFVTLDNIRFNIICLSLNRMFKKVHKVIDC